MLWLGEEGSQVVLPLRLLIPVAVFCFPNYVLGYPTMGAMGLAKLPTSPWCSAPLCTWRGGGAVADRGHQPGILCLLTSLTEAAFCLPAGGDCEKPPPDGRHPRNHRKAEVRKFSFPGGENPLPFP